MSWNYWSTDFWSAFTLTKTKSRPFQQQQKIEKNPEKKPHQQIKTSTKSRSPFLNWNVYRCHT